MTRQSGDDGGVPSEAHEPTLVTLGELETESLYDSLLRRVAASSAPRAHDASDVSSIRVHAEVGQDGKFVLQQEIGSGSMGRVYRALDRYLLRDVAIKFILRPEGMDHDDFMALFWQEAHIIARLDQHDNIVRILDVDRSSYPPFIVMEYLEGQSLEHLIRRGVVPVPMVLHVMIAVACGLGEAHGKGVYHRDLKPSNIFLQRTGRVKLLDFGLARIRSHLFETSTMKANFIANHAVPPLANAGTPAYMAPEQWRGEDADATTDLWAMGAIMYRLLAKAPAFDADSLAKLSARVLSGAPPTLLAERCPEAPAELCMVVDRLLQFERSARPSSVAEVIPILEAALRKVSSEAPQALAATLRSPSPRSEPWTTDSKDPFAHGSGADGGVRHWDRILLVLVCGADAAATLARDHLPAWIFRHAGVACDTLPCPLVAPSDASDLGANAIRLRGFLNARIQRPRHIFFITHGAGTGVVLRMLLDEARRLRPDDAGAPALEVDSPLFRTRHLAILGRGRGVATANHVASLHADPDTAPVVAELVAASQQFVDASLPIPAIHYFGIGDDIAALDARSPAVEALAAVITRPELTLARETVAQTFELDRAANIASLIAPATGRDTAADPGDDELRPTVPGARAATQAEVFEELVALVRTQHRRPLAVVIAGDAGVGKSTVLRMAARRVSGELLTDSGTVVPIVVPLHFASLTAEQLAVLDTEVADDRRGRVFCDVVLAWWSDWFNDITYPRATGLEWLKARMRSEPVALIFDGIDEFIINHPGARIADFQHLISWLGTEYRQNGRLTIICGARSTQPGLPALGSNNIREILRLTPAQARRQFPAAASWLAAWASASIQKLLLTPLILAQLDTRQPPLPLGERTTSDVLGLALTTIIEQSELCGRLDHQGQPIDAQRWIDALTAAAWCLSRRLRGEIATTTLRAEAAELHRSWREHLDATGQQAQGERLLAGFHLLCESRAFDALMQRTILYPTGRGEVRFLHREWLDFLAASYLAQVVAFRHVDEFRHVGNTARISRIAGELLCQLGVSIDEALVVALLRHAQATGAPPITANFAALLTNSRVLLDGPAIDVFLSAINHAPAFARYLTLSGLGYRALRGDDASAQDLRHRLARVFRDYLSPPAGGPAGPPAPSGLLRSLAWCHQKAYARRHGGRPVEAGWPGLDDDDERAVLAMMCSTSPEGPRVLAEHRAGQIALLEVQQVVAADPCRPISGIHYLYCLVVARRHGGGIAELGRELPALLAHDSPYAAAIERYDLVPELRDLLALCRRLAAD